MRTCRGRSTVTSAHLGTHGKPSRAPAARYEATEPSPAARTPPMAFCSHERCVPPRKYAPLKRDPHPPLARRWSIAFADIPCWRACWREIAPCWERARTRMECSASFIYVDKHKIRSCTRGGCKKPPYTGKSATTPAHTVQARTVDQV